MVELIYIFLITVVAVGSGCRLLRWLGVFNQWMAEELIFSFGLGMGAIALGVMALGLVHLLYEGTLYLLLLCYGVVGSKELLGVGGRFKSRVKYGYWQPGSIYFWLGILTVAGFFLNLLRALTPAYGAVDPLAYHLALPAIYLKKHYLSFEPTLTGALYPDNIGMLYTLAIGMRGAILAQLVHLALTAAVALAIVGFCRRFFDLRVGLWAAAIFSSLPVVAFFAPLGYVDLGVCFFQFMGFWVLFNWLEEQDSKMLLLAAIFTGLAMGAKHTAVPMWGVGLGIVIGSGIYRRQPLSQWVKSALLFGGAALLLPLPWYLRGYVDAGNPIWPIANHYFGGFPYYSLFTGTSGPAEVAARWLPTWDRLVSTSLWKWSFAPGEAQKAIGGYLVVLLPGLLVYARSRRILLLIGFCLLNYLILVFAFGIPRYNLYLFAFMSVLTGYVTEGVVRGSLAKVRGIFQAVFVLTMALNLALGYLTAIDSIEYFKSGESAEQFLSEHEGNYRVFQAVDRMLPENATVLLQGLVQGYYCKRPYLWDHPYQRVINYQDYHTPEALLKRMQELHITHIVRLIKVPAIRIDIGYPQYFADPFHEEFRKKYLKLLYRDESYALFELKNGNAGEP